MNIINLEIRAIPKGRPRFAGNHSYTPKRTREYETEIKTQLSKKITHRPLKGKIRMVLNFGFKKAKTSKLTYPHYDLDNLIKSFLDGAQGVLFENDKQITELEAFKTYSKNDLIVVIYKEIA